MRNADPAFAVLRVDPDIRRDEDRVTVKEVVWSINDAQNEVDRLNHVNADKGCLYFWTPTRVVRREDDQR
jgi:hypothetical protein